MGSWWHGSPNMSDNTLLVTVEDLINMSMGTPEVNVVNFKIMQSVLHILARQLRMLKTQVEVRISDAPPPTKKHKKKKQGEPFSTESVSSKSPRNASPPKASLQRVKEERGEFKDRKAETALKKEREKPERATFKERGRAEKSGENDFEKKEATFNERETEENDEPKDKKNEDKGSSNERDKSERAESKERGKAERAQSKEREKTERAGSRERDKADKNAKEKLAGAETKDREKAEKRSKENERLDKMSSKERREYEKELNQENREIEELERAKSAKPGISVKDSRTRSGSIEVVTLSQFEMIESAVRDLEGKAAPLPFPALPDNRKLRSELAKGSASLTDTMQAMQVAARVQAAETAIGRMAGLLTQLAAAGALPQDVAGQLADVKAEMDAITEEEIIGHVSSVRPRKSVAIDPMSKKASATSKFEGRMSSPGSPGRRPSATSRASTMSKSVSARGVTHNELDIAIRSLKDDLTKSVNSMTAKATSAAETASATAKGVANKLDIALKLNSRINSLNSLVSDYAEQLNGFDAGLTTQMHSFKEQIAEMRTDLKGGITLLESANNNAETAAIMELSERYEGLVMDLDSTRHAHKALTTFQNQLADELKSLLECVEMLREEKADRDEVTDGLRDKADISRLAGLLTEAEFEIARSDLKSRLALCYKKFQEQEHVWMGAIKDLKAIAKSKAEILQLLAAKDDTQDQLRDIQDKLQKLAVVLGEPKAAMLTRQLSKGARCGSCMIPALQEPFDISYGKPAPLPAARLPPAGEEKTCIQMQDWGLPHPTDQREHTCHRWVGGSHTLLTQSVMREQAGPLQPQGPPTKRYTDYGEDGRLYMLEEELKPCAECNMVSSNVGSIPEVGPAAPPGGASDTAV